VSRDSQETGCEGWGFLPLAVAHLAPCPAPFPFTVAADCLFHACGPYRASPASAQGSQVGLGESCEGH